ncbi:MAG: SDR family NAD(P)-dependent oxidoreductase [Gemmatimonadetes bacterium]|nr:SDR family NAD(P)-dependent oxidoreductase [Gemmatimonadota bacterium]MYI07488.1 SDR family NAD(P)-dependent oxidoreductase [Gemmatimonadota bacterium]
MNRIRGRTAIVTGATAGIGEACARALAAMGVRVVLTGRRGDRLEALARELATAGNGSTRGSGGMEPITAAFDVRDRAAVDDFAARLGSGGVAPDILVNNAGLARGLDTVQEGKHDDWDEMIDTNLKGLLNMTRAILPGMVARDSGHVVNIGSIAGRVIYPKGAVYCATKYAVRAITEGANVDLVGTRVRMSSVDPGMVETEFSRVRFRGDDARARTVYEGVDPLTPEDVADAVCYVLNTPPHVNVQQMLVMPTMQRSPYVLDRRPAETAKE